MGWPKGKKRPEGKVPGSGRKKGGINSRAQTAETLAKAVIEDEEYLVQLVKRARAGLLAPAFENTLFYYAYGKPPETIRHGEDVDSPFGATEARQNRIKELEAKVYALDNRRRA